jgi:peroxiredoxin
LTKSLKKRVQILAVSIDTHKQSKVFVLDLRKEYPGEFDIPLLEDKNHKVIDRYGILNPDSPGWPHPATYVIDKGGVVRWKFVEVDYRKRASNEQVLQALKSLP